MKRSWKGWALLYRGEPRCVTLSPHQPVFPRVRTGWKRIRIRIQEVRKP